MVTGINYSQETVTLTTSGTGKTKEDAKYNALRNALELTYGTFVSSNTQILNDQLVKDEIVSVTSGNIQKMEILSENLLPDGTYSSLLNVTVSVNKLKSFAQNKGAKVEFEGALFATNIKLEEINKKNEIIVLKNMLTVIEQYVSNGYDYEIKVGNQPERHPYSNSYYYVDLEVNAKCNKNIEIALEILKNTIRELYLNSSESVIKNQKYDKIRIDGVIYQLRSESAKVLITYIVNYLIPYYSTQFQVSNGVHNTTGKKILSLKHYNADAEDFQKPKNQYDTLCKLYYFIPDKDKLGYIERDLYNKVKFKSFNEYYKSLLNNRELVTEIKTDGSTNNSFIYKFRNMVSSSDLSRIKEYKIEKIR